MPSVLSINSISKTYANQNKPFVALKDVSLEIHQGEVFGLLGVNGAGKTTLSSIIATLHPPTAGDIHWQERSIYKHLMAYRAIIGFCPQKHNLDASLTVEQNLIFAGHYYLMSAHAIERRVLELLEQFGLATYAQAETKVLSGGYKQRLLIARSLMHNPDIIILDEPTVGLDPHIRHQLWEQIRILKAAGKTIILTTHYLDEAETLSDRVCILDKGHIRIIDTPENIMSQFKKHRLEDVFLQLTQENGSHGSSVPS